MIGHLRGLLREKRPNHVLLDVHGVGYAVHIPLSTFYALGELGTEASLLIHTHVREDSLALYGFHTAREKEMFEQLLTISGVGPRVAIGILSGMSVEELIPAIRKNDLLKLTTIPGVGRKTAERIVVELRDKLMGVEVAEAAPRASGIEEDVVSALVNLGYDRRAAERAVQEASRAGDPSMLRPSLSTASDSRAAEPRVALRNSKGDHKQFEPLLRASLQRISSAARRK